MTTRKKTPTRASRSSRTKPAPARSKTARKGATRTGSSDATRGKAAPADDMPDEVVEFITAIDEYKRKHQRPFPNWSEVLGIVKALGYTRD